MKRWQKVSLIIAGIVILLAGLVAFVLPGIVTKHTIQQVEASTGRKLSIGGLSINPFTWKVEAREVKFSERGGGLSFASFSSVRIDLSPSSLYRRAPIISAARVTSPYLRIVRTGANTYNFSDLLEDKQKQNEGGLPRFSLNNIALTNGSIDFIDQGLPLEKRHEVRKIELAVPFVTTIPYLSERYATPRFSAVVNGAPVYVEGKLRPFPKAVEASATIDLKDLSLPYYLAYVPGVIPVRVESGGMSAKVSLNYRAAQKENPELALDGSVTLKNVKVVDRTGAPFLAVSRLDAGIARAAFLRKEYQFSSVSADALEIFVSRDRKGRWNHSRLMTREETGAAPREKPLVSVSKTQLRGGRLHFSDSLRADKFALDLERIALDMQTYSTAPGAWGDYTVSFATRRGEQGRLKGKLSPLPLASTATFDLRGVVLEAYKTYIGLAFRSTLKGRIDVATGLIEFGGPEGFGLKKVALQARRLSLPFEKGEGIKLGALSLVGGSYGQKKNQLQVAGLVVKKGEIRVSRDEGGSFSPYPFQRDDGGGEGAKRKGKDEKPLLYQFGRITGTEMDIGFVDRTRGDPPGFTLKNTAFTLEKLNGPGFGQMPLKVAATYGAEGTFKASGRISPDPWSFTGEVDALRIPLADFDSYLPENLNIEISDGTVDARLALSLTGGGKDMTGSFDGSIGVRSFHCLDAEGEDLLRWESLQLDMVKGSLAPLVLDIKDVALNKFFSRIIIEKDGALNVQQLYTPEPVKSTPAAKGQTPGPVLDQGRTVRVGTVSLQDGTLAFTDRHMPRQFSTVFHKLGGDERDSPLRQIALPMWTCAATWKTSLRSGLPARSTLCGVICSRI